MSVTGINYEEGSKKKDLGYESVRVAYDNVEKEKVFDSGDFVKDWYNCNKWIAENLIDKEHYFANSSTVDHFIMDGAKFDSAYVKVIDDVAVLEYEYDYENPGQEFFVKKGTTPTWKELRELVK